MNLDPRGEATDPREESRRSDRTADATPSFDRDQGHFRPAEAGGLDIDFAHLISGGFGDGTQVFDIEYAWNRNHEDLRVNFPPSLRGFDNLTTPAFHSANRDHGTAVAGVVVATVNGIGVNGIAPNATFIAVSEFADFDAVQRGNISIAAAITLAASRARPGDVILFEVQRS